MTRRAASRPGVLKQNLLLLAAFGSAVILLGCGGGGGGGNVNPPPTGGGVCGGGSGTVVCGNVVDSNSNAVAGITVNLLSATGSVIATSTTNSNGLYKFQNVNAATQQFVWPVLPSPTYMTSLISFSGNTYQSGLTTLGGAPCIPPVAATANTENKLANITAYLATAPPPAPPTGCR